MLKIVLFLKTDYKVSDKNIEKRRSMRPVEYYPLLVKKKLLNLVDSTVQDPYSRRAYFCVQNRIGTGRLNQFSFYFLAFFLVHMLDNAVRHY